MSARALRVGYVGGIYYSKGVHVLVGAFRHLRGEPVELAIHGHLDWFPDYVAGLRRTAEGSAVRFVGPFDPGSVDAVLSQLDLLVLPSVWYENMPITIHEAHRHGIPVVVTTWPNLAPKEIAAQLTTQPGIQHACEGETSLWLALDAAQVRREKLAETISNPPPNPPPGMVRDAGVAAGVTINALAVLNEEPDLLEHYRAEVIGGPGCFAMDCPDYAAFAAAIRAKLGREIGAPLLAARPACAPSA